jgi:hypothetical protein
VFLGQVMLKDVFELLVKFLATVTIRAEAAAQQRVAANRAFTGNVITYVSQEGSTACHRNIL